MYPPEWSVRLVDGDGVTADAALGSLDTGRLDGIAYVYAPPLPWEEDLRSFGTLVEMVARLRAPDGCPWDREQTHESIARYLLEEAHEALEALEKGDEPFGSYASVATAGKGLLAAEKKKMPSRRPLSGLIAASIALPYSVSASIRAMTNAPSAIESPALLATSPAAMITNSAAACPAPEIATRAVAATA